MFFQVARLPEAYGSQTMVSLPLPTSSLCTLAIQLSGTDLPSKGLAEPARVNMIIRWDWEPHLRKKVSNLSGEVGSVHGSL